LVSQSELSTIIQVLEELTPGFRNKKEATEEANKYLTRPLSYGEWKNLWQRNTEVGQALDYLLIKNNTTVAVTNNPKDGYLFSFWDNPLDQEYEDEYLEETTTDLSKVHIPTIIGVTAFDQMPDPHNTYLKMMEYYDKIDEIQQQKKNQIISFTGGPICLVNIADIHFGGAVDVKRIFEEINLINQTPRMYINFLGDLGNNFIGAWTRKIIHNAPFTIEEEFAISRFYIEQISKRLIAFTAGNHDNWTMHEAGLDMMKTYLNETGSPAIYDPYENFFALDVDGRRTVVRTRHQWHGSSQYNDTHAIEKAARFDSAYPFDIGVGGHTHRSGLYREFNNGGKTGVAVLCGTYKRVDNYAKEIGFPQSNKSTAVCVIIDPESESGFHGISDIVSASKYMKLLYK
jgi:predicted phosphodiesterase